MATTTATLPEFRNEPYPDFSKPANRRPWRKPSGRSAPNSAANTSCASGGECDLHRRQADLGQPLEPAARSSASITRPPPSWPRRAVESALRLFPANGAARRPPSASRMLLRGRPHPARAASSSSTPGWSTKPAKPGPRPKPTSPKPSISANTTRARCSAWPARSRWCNCPASATS